MSVTEQDHLIAGRYRLRRRIGSGGMGVVWEAFDERLGRVVAIKHLMLPPGLSDDQAEQARARAMREGRIAARLQHPAAVTTCSGLVAESRLVDPGVTILLRRCPSAAPPVCGSRPSGVGDAGALWINRPADNTNQKTNAEAA